MRWIEDHNISVRGGITYGLGLVMYRVCRHRGIEERRFYQQIALLELINGSENDIRPGLTDA
ncbi:MAG TPA: hypothetical protein VIJ28_01845, partial [Chloroflexota bacterium]